MMLIWDAYSVLVAYSGASFIQHHWGVLSCLTCGFDFVLSGWGNVTYLGEIPDCIDSMADCIMNGAALA